MFASTTVDGCKKEYNIKETVFITFKTITIKNIKNHVHFVPVRPSGHAPSQVPDERFPFPKILYITNSYSVHKVYHA